MQKIGNIFFYILFTVGLVHTKPTIRMNIMNLKRQPLQYGGEGVPFLVEVRVTDKQLRDEIPEIKGLDSFFVQFLGSKEAENMQFTKLHTYMVRIDQIGMYPIGPAQIRMSDNTVIKSEPIMFSIEDAPKIVQKEVTTALVKMIVSPSTGYVGQKFMLKIKFFGVDHVHYQGLFPPPINGLDRSMIRVVGRGLETIDDTEYQFIEFQGEFAVGNAGTFTIPPCGVQYSTVVKRRTIFGFAEMQENRTVMSNEVLIRVKEVPHYDKSVNGVGKFTNFIATSNQKEMHVGDGIVYRLTLEGDADLEHIEFPKLILPDDVDYYESKVFLEAENDQHEPVKVFEYILQPKKAGGVVVPVQSFVYFDPEQEQFKTLTTEPIYLEIKKGKFADRPTQNDQQYDKVSHEEPADVLHPLSEHGHWHQENHRVIPFAWFVFLLLLPFFFIAGWFGWVFYRWYYEKNFLQFAYMAAFAHAKKRLNNYRLKNDGAKLYDLFCDLLAARNFLVPRFMSKKEMNQLLAEKLSPEKFNEWKKFFAEIQEQRFYETGSENNLFNRSALWIEEFEKVV